MIIIKSNKKKNKRIKIIISIISLIILLLVLLILLYISNNKKIESDFEIKSRVSEIQQEKEKDEYEYETVAWLRVDGTNIDYPIIIDKSGNYTNPIEKKAYGWLNSDDSKYKNNLTVDGHNLFNLGVPKKTSNSFYRFEELMAYAYYDFARENQFIQLTMDGKDYLYQIFAVGVHYDLDFENLPWNSVDEKNQKAQIDFMKEQSIYKYDIDVKPSDYILNVATCTRMLGKNKETNFVLSAKLIKNKKISLNSVNKTKKYDKIELILKGSEKNEDESI